MILAKATSQYHTSMTTYFNFVIQSTEVLVMKNEKLTKTQLALEILKYTKEFSEDLIVIHKLPVGDESLKNFYKIQLEGLIADFRTVAYKLLKLKIKK